MSTTTAPVAHAAPKKGMNAAPISIPATIENSKIRTPKMGRLYVLFGPLCDVVGYLEDAVQQPDGTLTGVLVLHSPDRIVGPNEQQYVSTRSGNMRDRPLVIDELWITSFPRTQNSPEIEIGDEMSFRYRESPAAEWIESEVFDKMNNPNADYNQPAAAQFEAFHK